MWHRPAEGNAELWPKPEGPQVSEGFGQSSAFPEADLWHTTVIEVTVSEPDYNMLDYPFNIVYLKNMFVYAGP